MQKKCKSCPRYVDNTTLIRCQSPKHRSLGDAFCTECASPFGRHFHDPYYCTECHPDNQALKRPAACKKKHKKRIGYKKADTRLYRLRQHLGLTQGDMAKFIGGSLRNYQACEKDDVNMGEPTKLLCYYICRHRAPKLVSDWPEGKDHEMQGL